MTSESSDDTAVAPTCRCGHGLDHFWVRPSYSYGFWGMLASTFGVSARPTRIDYTCGKCHQTLESVTDPAKLAEYRYGEAKRRKR
jgi:hypothetical protein